MAERLLKRREVEARVCLSRATIYERMARKEFPRPLRIGAQAVAWRESEIEDWIATRATAIPGGDAPAPAVTE